MDWICLICEEPVDIDPGSTGSMKPACWPCVEGGTINISFGWFSRFDDMNGIAGRCVTHQAVICDDCYEKKQHLTRPVVSRSTTEWEELPLDYREQRGGAKDVEKLLHDRLLMPIDAGAEILAKVEDLRKDVSSKSSNDTSPQDEGKNMTGGEA